MNVSDNPCEICKEPSLMGIVGRDGIIHYCCQIHIEQLWEKIGKP